MMKNEQSKRVDENCEEKVFDDKLYYVVRRKDSHVNTKVNPDGLKAAIQFDENNNLTGPVEIIKVAFFLLRGLFCPLPYAILPDYDGAGCTGREDRNKTRLFDTKDRNRISEKPQK